jgi:4-amino-4-deoxy-L-arabinose transferase-like glycosyltransferase
MTREADGWLIPAIGIVLAATVLRWVLLAFNQTDLFVDEAQYWLWGQEFDFGFYSKPPLIAWLIGGVTTLAGSDAPFWVRMPGAALHGVTALILAALTARLSTQRLAVWVAAAYVSLPMVGLGSLLMSTDTVMAPFFAAALYFHNRLVATGLFRHAILAGVMVGLATLAKYAGVYFLLGVGLSALFWPAMRIGWAQAGALVLAFVLVMAPNIMWNIGHGLSTLSHTVDNVGWVRQDNPWSGVNPSGLAEFFFSQFAVMGPGLFAALLVAFVRPSRGLLAFVLPALLVVCAQALIDKAYANWAVSAYFAGTILAMAVLAGVPRLRRWALGVNAALCIALPLLTLLPQLTLNDRPLLARYLGRADLSQQIIALARAEGNLPIVAVDRGVLADLFYTGRDAGLVIYSTPPNGKPDNHYQQRYAMPQDLSGRALLVADTAPDCAGPGVALDVEGGAYDGLGLKSFIAPATCLATMRS